MQDKLRNYYLHQFGIESWDFSPRTELKRDKECNDSSVAHHWCKDCALKTLIQEHSAVNILWVGEKLDSDAGELNLSRLKLFNQLLRSLGLNEQEVGMCFLAKCYSSIDSSTDELIACRKFLIHAIAEIKPRLIILLGPSISQFVLEETTNFTEMRNQVFEFAKTPVLVTFDVLHLLEHPSDKKFAYHDLQRAQQILNR